LKSGTQLELVHVNLCVTLTFTYYTIGCNRNTEKVSKKSFTYVWDAKTNSGWWLEKLKRKHVYFARSKVRLVIFSVYRVVITGILEYWYNNIKIRCNRYCYRKCRIHYIVYVLIININILNNHNNIRHLLSGIILLLRTKTNIFSISIWQW